MDRKNDFFAGCPAVRANRTLEVEIAAAGRIGVDGATIAAATVNPSGELEIAMTDGRSINAGRVVGKVGLKGMARVDTIPQRSSEAQLYLASGKGTYGYFRDRWGQPVRIEKDNTIVFLHCAAGHATWDYTEMEVEMGAYRKKCDLTRLSSKAPVFSHYPPTADPVEGLYDEGTGRFNRAPGQTTVTSQGEVFGRIVYADCSHVMIGFNLSYALYLEVETGKCLCMNVSTKEIHYHGESFAPGGISKPYVRVNTYNADSMVIDVEESDDGVEYTPYTRIDRGAWDGLFITYRTIGFYCPEGSDADPRILSIGHSDRLMMNEVPVITDPGPGMFEVLVPSDNFAGIARREIWPGGKSFAGKRIVLYGDSISNDYGLAPDTYAGLIRKKFGTDEVIGHAHTGETLGSRTDNKSDTLTNDEQLGYISSLEPDLLIFQGGVGDYWQGLELGEYYGDIEGAAYVKTTTGGLRYILFHLTKNLPSHTKILFVTPPPGINDGVSDTEQNARGLRMDEYVRRFREICAEYHVPVCDFWSLGGWATYNEVVEPYYTIDGVHLSERGYDRMTDLLLTEASRYC